MSKSSRLILAIVSLAFLVAYVQPLWRVTLEAPQYPEGLGMLIWVNTITGEKPHDLANINGLNHYIGMQEIVPDSIPELSYMPLILGLMAALGLLAAFVGKRRLLFLWFGLMVLLALVGLADFWRWTYEYGHNLDPTAAIKVPGMAYQPPVIGSKMLLNFKADSWPALGGWILVVGTALAGLATLVEARRSLRQGAQGTT
jgi:hypothetical protein